MRYMLLVYLAENGMTETEREHCYVESAQLAQDINLFLDTLPPVVKVHAQRFELDFVPAVADAKPQPAARQDIKCGGLFGNQGSLALGQDDNSCGEANIRGDRCHVGKQKERLDEAGFVGIRTIPAAGPIRVGAHYVIVGQHMREAQRLGGLRVVADRGGV